MAVRDLARIFKALSDPNRLAILRRIRRECPRGCRIDRWEESQSVSAIARQFDLALSTVSHHLKELRNAGLILCRKRGQWVYCAPNRKALQMIARFLRE